MMDRTIIDRTLATPYGAHAYAVVEKLEAAGYATWWVGGAVRHMLQGAVPSDIDIATQATPDQVRSVFSQSADASRGLGSCRVTYGGDAFEVTTFRQDHADSNGRHPQAVAFGSREDDADRRDFTVNAIYWHPMRLELWDPHGGCIDLHERLVHFIGNPAERITHDALRILRAVRLRAAIDGQYHPDTYAALRAQAGLTEILSPERLRSELEKLLEAAHPDRALEDLWELGILSHFLPELYACKGIAQPADYHREGDVWDHTLQCVRSLTEEHGADVRLAILFHDCGKVKTFAIAERIRFDHHATVSAELAEQALIRLQCPKPRREKITWLIGHHMSMTFLDMPEERKSHWYHHPWFQELLQVFWLDIAGTTPSDFGLYTKIVQDYHRYLDAHPAPKKALLTGEEIMQACGIQPGAAVGQIMKVLHEAQAKDRISTKKEALALVMDTWQRLQSAGVGRQQ